MPGRRSTNQRRQSWQLWGCLLIYATALVILGWIAYLISTNN